MPCDFMLRANTHMIVIVPLNEGACFFTFLRLYCLLYWQRYLRYRLCLICFNMLNTHANRIVNMLTCVHVHVMKLR